MANKEDNNALMSAMDEGFTFLTAVDGSSMRTVERGELVKLIGSTRGISKTALRNLVGNRLPTQLSSLTKNQTVTSELLAGLGYGRSRAVYTRRGKAQLDSVRDLDTLANAVLFYRNNGWLIGDPAITDNGDVLANAYVTDDYGLRFQFILVTENNYKYRLSADRVMKGVYPVYVFESLEFYNSIEMPKNKRYGLVFVQPLGSKMVALGYQFKINYIKVAGGGTKASDEGSGFVKAAKLTGDVLQSLIDEQYIVPTKKPTGSLTLQNIKASYDGHYAASADLASKLAVARTVKAAKGGENNVE